MRLPHDVSKCQFHTETQGVRVLVKINGNQLNVEVTGPEGAPVLIAHHGGGGIGSLAEPKATFGPLADRFRVIVFDAFGCGRSEGQAPYSHERWAADVDALREWIGAEKIVVAGGSYGGFIALEYAVRYPDRVLAMILRDTAADGSNLALAFENARNQDRVEINWENFNRYWSGNIRDNADLKACWAEMIPLYDFEYNAEESAKRVEAGFYRYEAHNWCFKHNWGSYDVKPALPSLRIPTLVTVGRRDWVTPVSSAQTIASLIPNAKLVIFEKSGHSPQFEEFELFQQTMREFLDVAVPATSIGP
jgi:proline iminopeptidase